MCLKHGVSGAHGVSWGGTDKTFAFQLEEPTVFRCSKLFPTSKKANQ